MFLDELLIEHKVANAALDQLLNDLFLLYGRLNRVGQKRIAAAIEALCQLKI